MTADFRFCTRRRFLQAATASGVLAAIPSIAQEQSQHGIIARPGLFPALTEPPCSYCSTQHRKRLVDDDDLVLAWIRGAHNGGAIPIRHFLAGPRVINDTYGLFFYDPDAGYAAAYEKDYGYEFYGWRRGVMVVRGRDGSLWSALSGVAFDGPQKGTKLRRIASLTTTWRHWLMLHSESTVYDLFDGKKYSVVEIPTAMNPEAKASIGKVDARLPAMSPVLGLDLGRSAMAVPLDTTKERACYRVTAAQPPVAVFWYGPTNSAAEFETVVDGRTLSFFADDISPETAPFKDRETGTRWTLAGRGVDGPLRGTELPWVSSIQCRWFAWSAEFPETEIHA